MFITKKKHKKEIADIRWAATTAALELRNEAVKIIEETRRQLKNTEQQVRYWKRAAGYTR